MSAANGADVEHVPEEARTIIDAIQSVPQVSDVTEYAEGPQADAMEEYDVSEPGGVLPPHVLPGFGDGPMQDYCGDQELHFCDECGDSFEQSRRCSQSRCPECWESWCLQQAEHITARADTVARTMASRTGEAHHKHHVTVQMSPDWRPAGTPAERMKATKEVIKTMIKDAWDAEGVAVYHGWSGSGYGDDEQVAPGVDDQGEWPDRLDPDNREWEGDVREELYARPHFHCIVVSDHIPGGQTTKAVYDETGWVIHRIADEESGRSITGKGPDGEMRALARAATYTLSHNSIDVTGDQNQAVQVRVGSAWHDSDVKVRDHVERSAKRAVRAVAPRTLGLSEEEVRCKQKIAPERRPEADEHHTHDHDDGVDDVEEPAPPEAVTGRVVDVTESAGTATLDVGGETRTVDVEEVQELTVGDEVTVDGDGAVEWEDPRVDCQGATRHISEAAEYISSADWVDRAQWSEETVEAWEWWQGEAGAPPP